MRCSWRRRLIVPFGYTNGDCSETCKLATDHHQSSTPQYAPFGDVLCLVARRSCSPCVAKKSAQSGAFSEGLVGIRSRIPPRCKAPRWNSV